MRSRPSRIRLLKQLYRQFGLYFYIGLAALLILLGVSEHPMISRVRISVAGISTGLVRLVYAPFHALGSVTEYVDSYITVRDENIKLKEENKRLLYWINRSEQLAYENKKLKTELNFVDSFSEKYWTAYIVADNGGVFSRSVLVRLGAKDGMKKGYVAQHNGGLVGRVASVGSTTSQILLLTDYASRVPVVVGEKRILGVVVGDNDPLLKLTALPDGVEVQLGDYVSTSGLGGVYPLGLAVGKVVRIEKENIWVRPFVYREDTPFLTIVDYGLDGLLDIPLCPSETENKSEEK